jgi:hypothetical protein
MKEKCQCGLLERVAVLQYFMIKADALLFNKARKIADKF